MDKLLAPTKEDLKLMLKRDYRQRQELARRERIFNPRQRIIGIDKTALDQHVNLKQHERLMKQKEELWHSMEQERQTKEFDLKMNGLVEEKAMKEREMNEFRLKYQRKDQARDYDLIDPLHLQKMPPGNGLEWLGEDPSNLDRIKMQQEQQKSWLQQQMHEKYSMQQDKNKADRLNEMRTIFDDQQQQHNAELLRRKRQQYQMDTAKYNLALAQSQKAKMMEKKKCEEEDNMAEIMNNLASDMLSESKDTGVASSIFGGKRLIPTMYKGMTENEIKNIRQEQLRQIDENLTKLEQTKESNQMYYDCMKQRRELLEIEEQELQKHKEQTLTEQMMLNAQLLREQKERNQHLNKDVYKFKPTDEYFEQFNKTTR